MEKKEELQNMIQKLIDETDVAIKRNNVDAKIGCYLAGVKHTYSKILKMIE